MRDLCAYDIVYLFIDGIAERIRPGGKSEPVLVVSYGAHGIIKAVGTAAMSSGPHEKPRGQGAQGPLAGVQCVGYGGLPGPSRTIAREPAEGLVRYYESELPSAVLVPR